VTPLTLVEVQKLLVKARSDYVVLTLVIFDMVIKPTGDDVGVLIGMVVVGVAGLAYIVMSLRAIDSRAQPVAAAA
jgi:curli biogenesis system outer membrane secretion channel CsgG